MVLHDAVNDGQAKARPLAERATKRLKQRIELLGGDPDPLVDHREAHVGVGGG